MVQKIDAVKIIQLLANRIRCSTCNSEEAVFVMGEDLRFRTSFRKNTLPKPMFIMKKEPMKMFMSKSYSLEAVESMTRVCLVCGASRKTNIPNI